MNKKKRVVIVDDHSVIGECLVAALSSEFEIVALAKDGLEALQSIRTHRPDLILLDLHLPGMHGLEVAQEVRNTVPSCRVVVLTGRADKDSLRSAMIAGVSGFVLKSDTLSELMTSLRHVSSGGMYIAPSLLGSMMVEWSRGTAAKAPEVLLSLRQRQVLKLVAEGSSTKEIGAVLNISPKTADGHRIRLMSKLNAHDVASLVRYAIREGIVEA